MLLLDLRYEIDFIPNPTGKITAEFSGNIGKIGCEDRLRR